MTDSDPLVDALGAAGYRLTEPRRLVAELVEARTVELGRATYRQSSVDGDRVSELVVRRRGRGVGRVRGRGGSRPLGRGVRS